MAFSQFGHFIHSILTHSVRHSPLIDGSVKKVNGCSNFLLKVHSTEYKYDSNTVEQCKTEYYEKFYAPYIAELLEQWVETGVYPDELDQFAILVR